MKPIGTIIYEGWGADIFNQVYYHYMQGEELPHLYVVAQRPFQLDGHIMYDRNYIDINTAMLEMFDSSPVIRWKNGGILKNDKPKQNAYQKTKKTYPIGSLVKWEGEYYDERIFQSGIGSIIGYDMFTSRVSIVLDTEYGRKEFTVADMEDENFVPTGITLITEKTLH